MFSLLYTPNIIHQINNLSLKSQINKRVISVFWFTFLYYIIYKTSLSTVCSMDVWIWRNWGEYLL